MRFSRRRLFPVAIVVVAAAACAGSAAGDSASVAHQPSSAAAVAQPCGLRLPPPVRGQLAFRIPSGGRAARRRLAGRLALCTLFRRDGSRFARLQSDSRQRVLSTAFFRPSGALRSASEAVYAATPSDTGSDVKCDSSSQASIGKTYWRTTRKWWIGATAPGIDRDAVVNAVRSAQSQWTNNVNWCGIKDQANPPAHYEGKTSRTAKHDGYSTVDWGSLKNDQDCNGALACTAIAYDEQGYPVEADTRFNTAFKWSTKGASGAYDIQSVAAHEIGHVIQFDHVTNSSKKDHTLLMWPYLDTGDTSGRKLGRGDALENNSHY
jgi:Matrixin